MEPDAAALAAMLLLEDERSCQECEPVREWSQTKSLDQSDRTVLPYAVAQCGREIWKPCRRNIEPREGQPGKSTMPAPGGQGASLRDRPDGFGTSPGLNEAPGAGATPGAKEQR